MMSDRNPLENNVVRLTLKTPYFPVPSIAEIATMSGQLSFLALSAHSFDMKNVETHCRLANEELGKWLLNTKIGSDAIKMER